MSSGKSVIVGVSVSFQCSSAVFLHSSSKGCLITPKVTMAQSCTMSRICIHDSNSDKLGPAGDDSVSVASNLCSIETKEADRSSVQ